jgi:adenylate kinase family enzyme
MQRVLVVGTTGSGKSTLARALADRLGLPYHEMDALYFTGPGWAVNPRLVEEVSALAGEPGWVVDSIGYPEVRDLLWSRADTVLWLNYPRRIVMSRVLRRSFRRSLTREPVFGGNRETWSAWFTRDHPAWSAWSSHGPRHREIARRTAAPRERPLAGHRFRHPRVVAPWLDALPPRWR